jgi:hypothetical protein
VLRTFGTALALSLDGKLRPTVLFLESEAGIGAIGRVLSSQPALLSLSIEANLRPKCAYLRELGMTDLGRLVSQYPPVLSLSLEDNLKPTAQALIQAGVLHPPDPNIRPRHLAASLDRRVSVRPFILCFIRSWRLVLVQRWVRACPSPSVLLFEMFCAPARACSHARAPPLPPPLSPSRFGLA